MIYFELVTSVPNTYDLCAGPGQCIILLVTIITIKYFETTQNNIYILGQTDNVIDVDDSRSVLYT